MASHLLVLALTCLSAASTVFSQSPIFPLGEEPKPPTMFFPLGEEPKPPTLFFPLGEEPKPPHILDGISLPLGEEPKPPHVPVIDAPSFLNSRKIKYSV